MNERLIRVQGQATVHAPPDKVVLSFDVSATDSSYVRAVQVLNEKVEQLRTELGKVGMARSDLKTTGFGVETKYRIVKRQNIFDHYEASHGLAVHLPMDRELLNRVLVAAAQSASQPEFRLSFRVKDEVPLRQQALQQAVAAAKQNAEILARSAGVSLGSLLRIEYGWNEVRIESEASYRLCDPSAGPDITPSDISAQESVALVWEMA